MPISDFDTDPNTVAENAANGTGTELDANTTLGGTVTWSITADSSGGAFTIDSSGVVTVVDNTKLDYETAAGHAYSITVKADNGIDPAETQVFSIAVTNVNDNPPVITSNGGGAAASINVAENLTAVTTVTATDADGATPTYSIVGGTDQLEFNIDGTTGALSFISAPNFESPTDSDTNNTYQVIVRASDGTNTDDQTITVTVTNTAPILRASNAFSVSEGTTSVGDVDTDTGDTTGVSYAILTGAGNGADGNKFSINSNTGVLSFLAAPNFESPSDSGGNNIYDVTVLATDGTAFVTQTFNVAVTNVAPTITSNGGGATASVSVAENSTAVTTVVATDLAGGSLTYSILSTAGTDFAAFTINPTTGALTFNSAPNFEVPTDVGGTDGDNAYVVDVQVSDGSLTDTQTITVNVTNVNEAPTITSNGAGTTASVSVAEGSTAVTTVTATDVDAGATQTYSIVSTAGTDFAKFTINPSTGVLTFNSAPNFEAPTDVGGPDGDNAYVVDVRVSDGSLTDIQTLTVNVTNVALGLKAANAFSVSEDATLVGNVNAPGADTTGVTYQIVNGPGLDSSLFTIDSLGVLSFVAPHDFESPNDADQDNIYRVSVVVSDGVGGNASQTFDVAVNDLPPALSSGNPDPVVEGTTLVGDPNSGSGDTSGVAYSIIAGLDSAKFTIDSGTGVLSFISAPDFENPTDLGGTAGDNIYRVTVAANDGTNAPVTHTYDVTVANSPTAASIVDTDGAANAVAENAANGTVVGLTAFATDGVGKATTSPLVYSLTNDDDGRFAIDSSTGVVTVADGSLLDFETATSHNITVKALGGAVNTTQAFTINLTNVPGITVNDSNASNPALNGTGEEDTLKGNGGNDVIDGLDGKDLIVGGLGTDTLTGGDGMDIFKFNKTSEIGKGAARDVIMDFETAVDKIDFSKIDANTLVAHNQAFKFIDGHAFSGKAGQLHVLDKGSFFLVEGDTNGDGRADFQFKVIGDEPLVGDFIR